MNTYKHFANLQVSTLTQLRRAVSHLDLPVGMVVVATLFCLMLTGAASATTTETLLIGPGDRLFVHVVDTPEMDQHPSVTDGGEIPLIGAGSVKVSGMTPAEAASVIRNRLIASNYMKHPEVVVSVEQFATQSVSVLGEVKASGAYPITTPRSVLDVLALAGGLSTIADRNILIQRHGDPQHPVHYVFSNNADRAVAEQVMVDPGDTVVVPKAGIVYVLGDVNRPGGYVMSNNESTVTVLQALAYAGGLTKSAKLSHARLIRTAANTSHSERDLSLGDLQTGKVPDLPMLPGDILYVPFSFARNTATMGAASIASAAASAAVYALP